MSEGEKHENTPDQSAPNPSQGLVLTPEQVSARGKRNVAIAISLLAFVTLVFFATYARLTGNIDTRVQDGTVPSSGVEEGVEF